MVYRLATTTWPRSWMTAVSKPFPVPRGTTTPSTTNNSSTGMVFIVKSAGQSLVSTWCGCWSGLCLPGIGIVASEDVDSQYGDPYRQQFDQDTAQVPESVLAGLVRSTSRMRLLDRANGTVATDVWLPKKMMSRLCRQDPSGDSKLAIARRFGNFTTKDSGTANKPLAN